MAPVKRSEWKTMGSAIEVLFYMKPRKQCPRGLAIGINRGHATTPIALPAKPSQRKGRTSKRTQHVRSIIREVAGFAPYERRVLELIRNSKDKKARKLTKRRLGTLRRAKRKVDELTGVIAEQRRAGH